MKRIVCGIWVIWVVIACTSLSLAAPEPAIVPALGQWTVDVEFTHPQQIVLRMGPNNQPIRFWYTILTLTNHTGNDVDFYPKCDLMTDSFQILPASRGVTPAIFEQIRTRHRGKYPFLEALDKAGNKILEGEDNAKDIAVIWPDFDAQATNIKLFITGLSNETAVVQYPSQKITGTPQQVFLRKTLELNYDLKGDPSLRADTSLTYKGKRWIMR